MILPPFELHRPASVDELRALVRRLVQEHQAFDFISGGTDVLPNYKNRLNAKPHLVSLGALVGFDDISPTSIGARARIAELAASSLLSEHWPGLSQAARVVAAPALRNQGTLGGNLCLDTRCYWFNQSEFWRASRGYCLKADGETCLVVPQDETCYATYSGDLAPVLLVLDATVRLVGPADERDVRLREFYEPDGIRRFVKRADECLLRVDIPASSRGLATGYAKLRPRDTLDYPVAGVALGLRVDAGKLADLRVAVTGTEPVPLYYSDLGLGGAAATRETGEALGAELRRRVTTYRNVPFPPSYRRAIAGELARGLFAKLTA